MHAPVCSNWIARAVDNACETAYFAASEACGFATINDRSSDCRGAGESVDGAGWGRGCPIGSVEDEEKWWISVIRHRVVSHE